MDSTGSDQLYYISKAAVEDSSVPKSEQKYCHAIPPQPDQVTEIPFIVTVTTQRSSNSN